MLGMILRVMRVFRTGPPAFVKSGPPASTSRVSFGTAVVAPHSTPPKMMLTGAPEKIALGLIVEGIDPVLSLAPGRGHGMTGPPPPGRGRWSADGLRDRQRLGERADA